MCVCVCVLASTQLLLKLRVKTSFSSKPSDVTAHSVIIDCVARSLYSPVNDISTGKISKKLTTTKMTRADIKSSS